MVGGDDRSPQYCGVPAAASTTPLARDALLGPVVTELALPLNSLLVEGCDLPECCTEMVHLCVYFITGILNLTMSFWM